MIDEKKMFWMIVYHFTRYIEIIRQQYIMKFFHSVNVNVYWQGGGYCQTEKISSYRYLLI